MVVGQASLTPAGDEKIHQHIGQGHNSAYRYAGDGTGSGMAGICALFHQPVGKSQPYRQLT